MGEDIRDLGLKGQMQKKGTPTMGGIIIIAAILLPTLLFAKLDNIYVILLVVTTAWLGLIGFLDDYIKVFKKNKEGLAGRFKIAGQIGIGIIVGLTLYFNTNVVVRQVTTTPLDDVQVENSQEGPLGYRDVKSTKTTFPFFKNSELDYDNLLPFVTF